jgi:hypothetical protein
MCHAVNFSLRMAVQMHEELRSRKIVPSPNSPEVRLRHTELDRTRSLIQGQELPPKTCTTVLFFVYHTTIVWYCPAQLHRTLASVTSRSCQCSKFSICLSLTFSCPHSLASGSKGNFRRFWSFTWWPANHLPTLLSCSGSRRARVRRISSMRAGGN